MSTYHPDSELSRSWTTKKKILVGLLVVFLLVLIGAGTGAYILYRSVSANPEETAKFVPPETVVFFSVNLRPGIGQLNNIRKIFNIYSAQEEFQSTLDDVEESVEEESELNPLNDIWAWMGAEVSVAVTSISGNFETAEAILFIQVADEEAAQNFIPKAISYLEKDSDIKVQKTTVNNIPAYKWNNQAYGQDSVALIYKGYMLVATSKTLISDTMNRLDRAGPSLYTDETFIRFRESAGGRFAFLFVNMKEFESLIEDTLPESGEDAWNTFSDAIPNHFMGTIGFTDKGVKAQLSYETRKGSYIPPGSSIISAVEHLPENTIGFMSIDGITRAWEETKTQVTRVSPDFSLDDLLDEVENETGINVDEDIFQWMAGDVTAALIAGDADSGTFSSVDISGIEALVLLGLADREGAISSLTKIGMYLDSNGLPTTQEKFEHGTATIFDFSDLTGDSKVLPGYFIADQHLIVSSDVESISSSISRFKNSDYSLGASEEFKNIFEEMGVNPVFLLFLSIDELSDLILDQLSYEEINEYRDSAAKFIDPMQYVVMGVNIDEKMTTGSIMMTFADPQSRVATTRSTEDKDEGNRARSFSNEKLAPQIDIEATVEARLSEELAKMQTTAAAPATLAAPAAPAASSAAAIGAYEIGLGLIDEGNYQEAVNRLSQSILLDSSQSETFNMRGYALGLSGDHLLAIEDFNQAIYMDDLISDYYLNRCWSYLNIFLFNESIWDCESAIELRSSSPWAYSNLADAHAGLGLYDLAIQYHAEAIANYPEHGYSYHWRGVLLSYLGATDEAKMHFDIAADMGYTPAGNVVIDGTNVSIYPNISAPMNFKGLRTEYLIDANNFVTELLTDPNLLSTVTSQDLNIAEAGIQLSDLLEGSQLIETQLFPKERAAGEYYPLKWGFQGSHVTSYSINTGDGGYLDMYALVAIYEDAYMSVEEREAELKHDFPLEFIKFEEFPVLSLGHPAKGFSYTFYVSGQGEINLIRIYFTVGNLLGAVMIEGVPTTSDEEKLIQEYAQELARKHAVRMLDQILSPTGSTVFPSLSPAITPLPTYTPTLTPTAIPTAIPTLTPTSVSSTSTGPYISLPESDVTGGVDNIIVKFFNAPSNSGNYIVLYEIDAAGEPINPSPVDYYEVNSVDGTYVVLYEDYLKASTFKQRKGDSFRFFMRDSSHKIIAESEILLIRPVPTQTPTPTMTYTPTPTPYPVGDMGGGSIEIPDDVIGEIDFIGDTDEWVFTAYSGQRLSISMERIGSDLSPQFTFSSKTSGYEYPRTFDSEGKVRAYSESNPEAYMGIWLIPLDGDYVIKAHTGLNHAARQTTGKYNLTVSFTDPLAPSNWSPTPTPTPTLTPTVTPTPVGGN